MVVMQCHVLGVVVVPPLLVAWLADVRGRRRRDERLGPAVGAGVGSLAILAAGYLPLLAFELQHDFAETRAILAYLGGSGSSAASGALARIGIVGARSIAWPVSGLFTDRPLLATVAVVAACALAAIAVLAGRGIGRRAAAWLAGSVAWAIVALALFAPSLAVITPGLPNDHYHSFLDPLVLALLGAGIAHVAGRATDAGEAAPSGPVPAGRTAAAAGVGILLVVVSIVAWPPATSPDGGWRLADAAAARTIRGRPGICRSSSSGSRGSRTANAMRFPLEHRGASRRSDRRVRDPGGPLVVVCDPLFNEVVGAACGGPAEDALLAAGGAAVIGPSRPFRRRIATRHLGLRRQPLSLAVYASRLARSIRRGGVPLALTTDVVRISRRLRRDSRSDVAFRGPICGSLDLVRIRARGAQARAGRGTAGGSRRARAARRQPPENANAGPCRPAFAVPETRTWRDVQVMPWRCSMVDPGCGSAAARAAAGRRSAAGGRGPREPRRRR